VFPLPERQPVPEEVTAQLQAMGIWQMVNAACYGVFVREGCMAVVQRNAGTGAYISIGSTGYSLESGVAFLVWQDGEPYLTRKGNDPVPATPEQVAIIRKFAADVESALGLKEPAQ
jgi:hypothetical protein